MRIKLLKGQALLGFYAEDRPDRLGLYF